MAREAELQTLLQLWQSARLVTLFGQSGAGKSALAQAAAAELNRQKPGCVRSLDAGAAPRGAAVLRLLVRVQGRAADGRSARSGSSHEPAGSSPFFVLLDDLPASAHGVARGLLQWLVTRPSAHLLVVSRRPLGLVGEQVLALPPLAVSAGSATPPAAAVLLEHYARLARPGSPSLEPAARDAIGEALDGLPSALEAAAGLLGALPGAEVERIAREEPLRLSLRGTPVRATLAATWGDLTEEAREYLAANAGWPAGFSDEAGAQLAAGPSAAAVVPLLIQTGLLRITQSAPRLLYRLSPLLRAWMIESGSALTFERQQRLAGHLQGWAESWAAGRDVAADAGPPGSEELAAMRWAWRWLAGRRDREAIYRFARALAGPLSHESGDPVEAGELLQSAAIAARMDGDPELPTWEARLAATEVTLGRLDAAEARLRRLLRSELPSPARAQALLALGAAHAGRGRHASAAANRRDAIALLRAEPPPSNRASAAADLGWALHALAEDHRRLGDPDAARWALEESALLFSRLECRSGRAAVLAARGALHADAGQTEEARWHAQESLALAESAGDRPGRARALQLAGRTMAAKAPDEAMRLLEEALSLWERMHRPAELAAALLEVASMASCPVERALSAARAARQLARDHGFPAIEAAAALALAETYRRCGHAQAAAEYAEEARRACEQIDDRLLKQCCHEWAVGLRRGEGPGEGLGVRGQGSGTTPASPALTPDPSPLTPRAPLLIRLLGPFTIEGPGGLLAAARLRPKEQRILARLALDRGRLVPRDELLELFWPQSPVAAAERSLRTVVSSLRAALRPVLAGTPTFGGCPVRVISGRLDGYCLEAEASAVDADLFATAVRAARGVPGDAPPAAALACCREAYELYRGDLLNAFLYEDWCLTARERLRDDFLDVLFRLALAALQNGSPDEARGLAARMVEIDAAEERAHRLLMRCYTLLDRPAEALRQFERCRAALWDELGARPAPSTLALLEAIRASAPLAPQDEEAPECSGEINEALLSDLRW